MFGLFLSLLCISGMKLGWNLFLLVFLALSFEIITFQPLIFNSTCVISIVYFQVKKFSLMNIAEKSVHHLDMSGDARQGTSNQIW